MRLLVCACILNGLGWGQTPKALTARELFYAASPPALAPKPATPVPRKPPRPAARKKAPPSRPRTRPEPEPEPARQPAPIPAGQGVGDPGERSVVRPAAYGAQHRPPLGLRYTILKLSDGRMAETAPDTVFHAGDRIQLSVEVNDAGCLYVIHQGSSGAWKPMFPSAQVEDGNNRVQARRTYILPPGSRFVFDERPGEERLFVVLSREPVADLEKLIYSLESGTPPAPAAQPAAPARPQRLLLAANLPSIDNALVGRLRNAYARDLVIEQVNGQTPGPRRETAVYVVNPNGAPDSSVVADIRLIHH